MLLQAFKFYYLMKLVFEIRFRRAVRQGEVFRISGRWFGLNLGFPYMFLRLYSPPILIRVFAVRSVGR